MKDMKSVDHVILDLSLVKTKILLQTLMIIDNSTFFISYIGNERYQLCDHIRANSQ